MSVQITPHQAQPITALGGEKLLLRPDAAVAWDRACKKFGKGVLLTGALRSGAVQEVIFRQRYVMGNHRGKPGYTNDVREWNGRPWTRRAGQAAAAVPGTSNHGTGCAVDVKTSRAAGDPPRGRQGRVHPQVRPVGPEVPVPRRGAGGPRHDRLGAAAAGRS